MRNDSAAVSSTLRPGRTTVRRDRVPARPDHAAARPGGEPRPDGEPPVGGPPEKRTAKLAWIVGFGVAAVLLYVAFLRLSWTFQVNSDGANIDLMAWDMLHGNWLLHGWYTFDVPYLTTEIPQYALLEAIFGLTPVVTHIAAAMTYTLAVLGAMLLAKGSTPAHHPGPLHREALIRVLVAGGIMLAPQYNHGVFILVLSVGHIGASVPLLAVLLILDRARPRWQVAALAGVLLAWATMGDSLTYVLGSVPLAVACAYRVARAATARPEPAARRTGLAKAIRTRRYEVQLAIAALASIGVAEAGLKLVHALGGFNLYPVQFHFMGLNQLTQHLALTWRALLILFGADYYHHQHGIWLAAAALHFVGMALAAVAVAWGVWRYFIKDASLVEQVLVGGVVLNLLLFATSNVAKMDAHELAIVLPFSAALAGRAVARVRAPGWMTRRHLAAPARKTAAVLGVAALAGYLACLVGTDTLSPAGPGESQLASFLESRHLTHGIAGYWEASMVTVDTGDQVQVRAITDWKKFLWGTKSSWYKGYANFIVEQKGYDYSNVASAEAKVRARFGTPVTVYAFGDYLVMVYDKNLLASVHGSTY
jgi:hypothetical protein